MTDLAGVPPAHIAVGALDLFVDEGTAFARRLNAAGMPVEWHVCPGTFHGAEGHAPAAHSRRAHQGLAADRAAGMAWRAPGPILTRAPGRSTRRTR